MKDDDKPRPDTQNPRGSQNDDGFSGDSIMNDVEVIVKINTKMKFPSNCDFPLSFSGVKMILLVRAARAPKRAVV